MNQVTIGVGTDATVLLGYAQAANERLGNIGFLIQNTGDIAMYFQLRSYDGVSSPSGYAAVGAPVTIQARGSQTIQYNLLSQRVGFFGSGVAATITVPSNATGVMGTSVYRSFTTADITAVFANPADLRGAQLDLVATGRKAWAYDAGFNLPDTQKKWGSVAPVTGIINPNGPSS